MLHDGQIATAKFEEIYDGACNLSRCFYALVGQCMVRELTILFAVLTSGAPVARSDCDMYRKQLLQILLYRFFFFAACIFSKVSEAKE